MNLEKIKDIYFLGIGGIGMSALARYFHLIGKKVTGYDRAASIVTKALEEEGIEIFYNLDTTHISSQDMMVYTPAISRENIEYQMAEKAGIPILKRSEVLGIISREYRCLAVAGTHGKTTTSAMLSHLLRSSGLEATAFLGGISNNLQSNFAFGTSDLVVAEADEYDRSFLRLHPYFSIITSMDPDHLDIYGSHEEMKKSFKDFASQSQKLLVHEAFGDFDWDKDVQTYGLGKGDFRAENLKFEGLNWQFDFIARDQNITTLSLSMPGVHNVSNMVAALAIAWQLGAKAEELKQAVGSFSGIYRRFEVHHHDETMTYIDDYAHHPTELDAAISTAQKLFPSRQKVVLFQPHLFTRTRDFSRGFAKALSMADVVLLLEIYPAREKPISGVNSEMLLRQISCSNKQLIAKSKIVETLESIVEKPAVVLSLGAGDIDREIGKIAEWIKQKNK